MNEMQCLQESSEIREILKLYGIPQKDINLLSPKQILLEVKYEYTAKGENSVCVYLCFQAADDEGPKQAN